MKFWDSSAIVPLLCAEPYSTFCRTLLQEDPEMLVWVLTPTEIYSAYYRKVREGMVSEDSLDTVRERLTILEACWSTVVHIDTTQELAQRLLAVHSLRAADALQLAAALVAFDRKPSGADFVSFDDHLNRAARREGFLVRAP